MFHRLYRAGNEVKMENIFETAFVLVLALIIVLAILRLLGII